MEKEAAEGGIDPWLAFVAPVNSRSYFSAWLQLVCSHVPGTTAGALLLRDAAAGQLLPIATWPDAAQDLARLGKVVEDSLSQKRGVLIRAQSGLWHVGYPILVDGQVAGAVAVETSGPEADARALLRYLHWGLGWIVESLGRRDQNVSVMRAERLDSVMEAIASALKPAPLRELLHSVVGDVSRQLGCARVGIGLVDQDKVRVEAISDTAWIERNGILATRYRSVMEEALDAAELIRLPDMVAATIAATIATTAAASATATTTSTAATAKPATPSTPPPPGPVYSAHEAFMAQQGATSVLTCPLTLGLKCVAVMTLEWQDTERQCTDEDVLWLRAYAGMLGSVVEDRRLANQGMLARGMAAVKALGVRLFGPRHLLWKTAAASIAIVTAAMVLVPVDYRVTGKTVIEGETVRTLGAPFEGFIASTHARAGDVVKEGQLLAVLEDNDLKVELAKATGEKDQHERKLREAMATHEMGSAQVAEAQVRQAQAQLNLASEKMRRARVTAPFAGTVVSGDLSQLVGSPVEQGKKLFEIAPLEGYRVIVQVDERDIRHVREGQPGKLLIAGIASEALPFTVTKVTPVASAQEGKNTFRVEARLAESSGRLRPGMEGVGKIATAEQSLWWVVTHGMFDWLRLQLWSWLP